MTGANWQRRILTRKPKRINISAFNIGICTLVALCIGQVLLGGDILLIACSIFSICVGLLPIWLFGLRSTIGLFFALLIVFFPASALLVKTLLLQPIQSNLFVPDVSFEVMACGMAAACAAATAAFACQKFTKWKAMFQPLSIARLQLLCLTSAIIAIIGILGRDLPGGLGRLAALTNGMIFLSLVAATQLTLIRTHGRRGLSVLSGFLFTFCFVMGIATNSKQAVLGAVLCYSVPGFLYRRTIRRLEFLSIIFGAIALITIVTPAVQAARELRGIVDPLSLAERTFSLMAETWSGNSSAGPNERNDDGKRDSYYIHYVSDTTNVIDRLVFVSYVDALLRFSRDEFIGYGRLWASIKEDVVPNLVDPGQKTIGSSGDIALQNYGVFSDDFTSQISFPLFGQAFLTDGLLGVCVITFMVFFPLCVILVFVFGDIFSNVYGIWWLTLNGFIIACADSGGILFYILRILPIYILMDLVIRQLVKRSYGSSQRLVRSALTRNRGVKLRGF